MNGKFDIYLDLEGRSGLGPWPQLDATDFKMNTIDEDDILNALKENPQLVDMQNVPHVESKVDDGAASVATVPPAQPAPVQPISIRNEDISDELDDLSYEYVEVIVENAPIGERLEVIPIDEKSPNMSDDVGMEIWEIDADEVQLNMKCPYCGNLYDNEDSMCMCYHLRGQHDHIGRPSKSKNTPPANAKGLQQLSTEKEKPSIDLSSATQCTHCTNWYKSVALMKKHRRRIHDVLDKDLRNVDHIVRTPPSIDLSSSTQCTHCPKWYKNVKSMKLHRNRNHGVSNKRFKNVRELVQRTEPVASVTDEDGIKCMYGCSQTFRKKVNYDKHLRRTHDFKSDHRCKKCNYSAHTLGAFLNHIKRTHMGGTGKVGLHCFLCNSKSKSVPKLRKHFKEHDDVVNSYMYVAE